MQNRSKNFDVELQRLVNELNQKISVCKQREIIVERFIDNYKV